MAQFNSMVIEGLTSLRDNSDDEINFTGEKTKVSKARGANKKYYHVETHDTKEASINSIKEHHSDYVYLITKKTKIGQKNFYRCKHSPVNLPI